MITFQGIMLASQGAGLIAIQYVSLLCFVSGVATLAKDQDRRKDAKEVLKILMVRRRPK